MNEHIISMLKLNDFIKNHKSQNKSANRAPVTIDRFKRVGDIEVKPYADELAYLKSFALNKSRQRKSKLMKDMHIKNNLAFHNSNGVNV